MRQKRFRVYLILSLLWVALIFLHSAMPATVSKAESGGLLALLQRVLPWLTHNMLRKAAHFAEYAVLGALLTGVFRNTKSFALSKPLLCGLLVALGDETLQLYVAGRAGMLTDVWLDFSGLLAATLLLWLLRKR
ncbi:MAG: VanZ family protein [Oscillospiraceae bacterium]|jgi:VanZ family protein|nr:VanZ family protein [Oscillospiraceae bacterium]